MGPMILSKDISYKDWNNMSNSNKNNNNKLIFIDAYSVPGTVNYFI